MQQPIMMRSLKINDIKAVYKVFRNFSTSIIVDRNNLRLGFVMCLDSLKISSKMAFASSILSRLIKNLAKTKRSL